MEQSKLKLINIPDAQSFFSSSSIASVFWEKVFEKTYGDSNVSDIHLEPTVNGYWLSFRSCGDLITIEDVECKNTLLRRYVVFIKEISSMDISRNKGAQSSAFSLPKYKCRYRVQCANTALGEKLSIRVIRDDYFPSLDDLGFKDNELVELRKTAKLKSGIIVLSGTTGSGKSTTMQAFMKEINPKKTKIISIEDPVERIIPYVSQKEISKEFGWADSIKSAMREDPDVIMIGEIRDKESAELALKSAQTGHLVITTLHSLNTRLVISRMERLGISKDDFMEVFRMNITQQLEKYKTSDGLWRRKLVYELIICDENFQEFINKTETEYNEHYGERLIINMERR